jgi:dolichyl-phosphate beta-glucosyltransferase
MLPENHPRLSIVIPVFNEESRLPETLRTLDDFVRTKSAEVLVVVEKSRDRTLSIAEDFARDHPDFRVLANSVQRGKGYAVKQGMLQARGDFIFFMDVDLSVPLAAVDVFTAEFESNPQVQILVGNRQHKGSDIVVAQGWLRRGMGQMFNRWVRRLSGIPLRDTQCGFKAFRREAAHELFAEQTLDGFAFDVEILLLAQKKGYAMADLPVEWHNSTASKVHILHDSLKMLWDVWRLRRLVNGG